MTGRRSMGHYKSNVRDLEFNLFEVLDLEKALATGEFGDLDGESVREMLRRGRAAGRGTAGGVVRRRRPQPADVRPGHAHGEHARVVQEVAAGLAARASGSASASTSTSAACPRRRCWPGRSTSSRSVRQPGGVHVSRRPDLRRHPATDIGNEQQRHWAALAIERKLGRHHGAHRARRRLRCRRRPHQGDPATRRHLAHRRRQAVHHQRRHRRPVREHHAPGAGPPGGRRTRAPRG